jgi:lysophospholipase L1-like esterase
VHTNVQGVRFGTMIVHRDGRWALALLMSAMPCLFAKAANADVRMPTHVACVGDSITEGFASSDPATKSYPAQLQGLFGSKVSVKNFGRSGTTMLSQGFGDNPYEATFDYQNATAFVAGAGASAVVDVIIILGTNDSKPNNWTPPGKPKNDQQFLTDYRAMVEHFLALTPKPEVFLGLPLSTGNSPCCTINGTVIHDEELPLIKQLANEKSLPIIDLNTPTANHPEYFVDGVHPTDAGYLIVAKLVHAGLLQDLSPAGADGGAGGGDGGSDVGSAGDDGSAEAAGRGRSGGDGSVGDAGSAGADGSVGPGETGGAAAGDGSASDSSEGAGSTEGGSPAGPSGNGSNSSGCGVSSSREHGGLAALVSLSVFLSLIGLRRGREGSITVGGGAEVASGEILGRANGDGQRALSESFSASAAAAIVLSVGIPSCATRSPSPFEGAVDQGAPPSSPADGGQLSRDSSAPPLFGGLLDSSASPLSGDCANLCQRQVVCPRGGSTILSGVVHAPTPAPFGAADPLYNVLVYVPNAPVAPFASGVACQRCEKASGSPLVSALTGPDGKFSLRNVPTGANIPLVIQVGRWRRQVTVPNVPACTETALPDELTRLPRNQQEGDIPAIAIATGTYDAFDCTLRKIGVAEAEFTPPPGNGRVNLWPFGGHDIGGGSAMSTGDDLLGSPPSLGKYDLVILPCNDRVPKDPIKQANLFQYANEGGRVFLTDMAYSWLRDDAAFSGTVTWDPFLMGGNRMAAGNDFTATVDVTFPKGAAFSAWLSVVGAARPMAGQLPVQDPYGGTIYVSGVIPPTQRWTYVDAPVSGMENFTFNTPIGVPDTAQCGRFVFSQFHVAEASSHGITVGNTFPAACDNNPMTPQERALEFMLFDLSSCVQSDVKPPVIPQ